MKLSFLKIGSGTKPFLIVHGLFGNGKNWESIAGGLADDFTFYLPDLRNHGRSPHHKDISYDAVSEDLAEFVDKHNLKDFILLGHSQGSIVASALLFKRQELISKFISVETSPPSFLTNIKGHLDGLLKVNFWNLKSEDAIFNFLEPYIPDYQMRLFYTSILTKNEWGELCWSVNLENISNGFEEISISPFKDNDLFNKPTMLMEGVNSQYGHIDHSILKKHFPLMEVREIDNAGHYVQVDQPQEVINTIKNFCNS